MEHLCRYKSCLNYGAVVARVELSIPVEEDGQSENDDIEVIETKDE